MSARTSLPDDIDGLLKRGVAEIIVEADFVRLLESGRPLRLKMGFDPSAPDIHFGHAVGLRKLRQLQELGHQVVVIVGDWTARIGDPSGRSSTRPMLSPDQVEANAQTYLDQFFTIVDRDRTEVRRQTEWFGDFSLGDVLQLTSRFTVAQMLAREDFSKGYAQGNPIAVMEFLYPLLQAYDSTQIQADVEFGGTDQKFNCLVGRELQGMMGQTPQQVFLVPILVGTDGVNRMSKSLGNYIGVCEPPESMFGKIMSLRDELMLDYFRMLTDVPSVEIDAIEEEFKAEQVNPRDMKVRLARELVAQFHDAEAAAAAEESFDRVFSRREVPEEAPILTIAASGPIDLPALLVEAGVFSSKGEVRRLIAQGAVDLNDVPVRAPAIIENQIADGDMLKVGKRRFFRIKRG